MRSAALLLTCVLAFMSIHSYVSAECCARIYLHPTDRYPHPQTKIPMPDWCGDCSRQGLFQCCAHGPCNIFCCNCDDGCRRGSCEAYRHFTDLPGYRQGRSVSSPDSQDKGKELYEGGMAAEIVRRADTDKDGRLSYQEAHAYLGMAGEPRFKRELQEIDIDGDSFITAQEIDPQYYK